MSLLAPLALTPVQDPARRPEADGGSPRRAFGSAPQPSQRLALVGEPTRFGRFSWQVRPLAREVTSERGIRVDILLDVAEHHDRVSR